MNWLKKSLVKYAFPAMEAPVPSISPQEAHDTCYDTPFYHGTLPEVITDIKEHGFKWQEGEKGSEGMSHGYDNTNYYEDCPAPVHHLGYGIYLTQIKSIAKDFGYGSMRNVVTFLHS